MSSRAFDFALAGSKGVKVLPDITTMPAVGDVMAAGSIVGSEVFLHFQSPSGAVFSPLPPNAANDAAASAAGVPVGGTYRNGSVLMVRVV
jgi:hypothetical protein